ncbi:hypothetical protein [Streptomyces sp. cg35]|uniref:hypothetical protein n=1 Tax=Streptomyces sp. cg35 TaxID=3421650 RepID=UPI003D16BB3B
MSTDPTEPTTCAAEIVNEHSGGRHRCTLEAGHAGGQFDGDHAGPADEKGVRYCWSDHAVGAVPHSAAGCGCKHPVDEHSVYGCANGCGCEWMPGEPAASTPPAGQNLRDRRERYAAALKNVRMMRDGKNLDRQIDAILAVADAERENDRLTLEHDRRYIARLRAENEGLDEALRGLISASKKDSSRPPADRAAVLRDLLWRLGQSAGDAAAEKFLDDNPDLRRMADEAQQAGEGR